MFVSIDKEVLERFPEVEIGYLVAQVEVKETDPQVEQFKKELPAHITSLGINATTFVTHPNIAKWRAIYEEHFGVKAKTYRSSIESLLRRIVTGKGVWDICNIVDLYNCCSVLSMLPMGGYDLNKISGDVKIRYGKAGETFLGLGERQKVSVDPRHVVYADDARVICWLWNHKDAAETGIDEESKSVIFFIDSFDRAQTEEALRLLAKQLSTIGCTPMQSGILNKSVFQQKI